MVTPLTPQVEILEYAVPAGVEVISHPLGLDDLARAWKGWAWCRVRPTWFDATPISSLADLREHTVHFLLVADGPDALCVYPLSSNSAISCLERGAESPLCVRVRSTSPGAGTAGVVVVRGPVAEIATLPALAVRAARDHTYTSPAPPLRPQLRGPFDGLGCCTWSALGEDVHPTAANLAPLVDAYVAAGLPVQTFILDDGWQNQRDFTRDGWTRRGLWDFEAHPDLGAGGLAAAIEMVQDKFAAVDGVGGTEVGVWVTLTGGYWDGINPSSPLVDRYGIKPYAASRKWWPGVPNEKNTVAYMPGGKCQYWLPPPETARRFWQDWFSVIKKAGGSFVKVDNQATLSSLDGAEGAAAHEELWSAMVAAADDVFGPGRVIHCMAHSEPLFAGPAAFGLLTNEHPFVWRNSDDFGMEHRQRDAHQQQIFTNLTNTLVTNHLAIVPDADMWMTNAMWPATQGFLRALFPGPMLLTDKPGQHDPKLLWRVIAKDRTGVARVVKTESAAALLGSRMLDTSVLEAVDGTGLWASVKVDAGAIIGVWNVRGDLDTPVRVVDALTAEDVAAAIGGVVAPVVVVRTDLDTGGAAAGTVIDPMAAGEIAKVELETMAAAEFWVAPLVPLDCCSVAVLGLVDQFAGMIAIESCSITGNAVNVKVKYAGTLGVAVTGACPAAKVTVDGAETKAVLKELPALEQQGGVYLVEVEISGEGQGDVWDVVVCL